MKPDDWNDEWDDEWYEYHEKLEQQERCRNKGMEYVSGHFRYKNGRKVAYIKGHCRKVRR